MMSKETTVRKDYLTVLNVFAALSVVTLHTNGCFWSFSYETWWISANIMECVFYFAVPMFFMICGATLMDYRERYDTKTYFIRRIEKTVIPFLVWSLLGLVYQLCSGAVDGSEIGIRWLINSVFNTSIISIYWYFIPQFAVYLLIPFISKIEKSKRECFRYAIACLLLFDVLLPFAFGLLGLQYNGALKTGSGYIIYVLMGYYIDNYPIKKKARTVIYILGIAGLLAHIIGTWKLSYEAGSIVGTYKGYLNLPCVLYSAAIFVFFKYTDGTRFMGGIYRIAKPFDGATLGIYLMHIYILWQIPGWRSSLSMQSFIYRLLAAVLIFAASALITRLLQKIPVVKRIVPG